MKKIWVRKLTNNNLRNKELNYLDLFSGRQMLDLQIPYSFQKDILPNTNIIQVDLKDI